MQFRLTWISGSLCFSLLRTGITGLYHHEQLLKSFIINKHNIHYSAQKNQWFSYKQKTKRRKYRTKSPRLWSVREISQAAYIKHFAGQVFISIPLPHRSQDSPAPFDVLEADKIKRVSVRLTWLSASSGPFYFSLLELPCLVHTDIFLWGRVGRKGQGKVFLLSFHLLLRVYVVFLPQAIHSSHNWWALSRTFVILWHLCKPKPFLNAGSLPLTAHTRRLTEPSPVPVPSCTADRLEYPQWCLIINQKQPLPQSLTL